MDSGSHVLVETVKRSLPRVSNGMVSNIFTTQEVRRLILGTYMHSDTRRPVNNAQMIHIIRNFAFWQVRKNKGFVAM